MSFSMSLSNSTQSHFLPAKGLSPHIGSPAAPESSPPYEVIHFKENEFVFRQGETPKGLYLIQSGCVKEVVHRSLTRGRMASPEYISRVAGSGDFIGYSPLIRNENHSSFAKTLKPTEIHFFTQETVQEILNGQNSLLKALLSQAIQQIESHGVIEQLHYLASVQERIAYQLLLLSDKFGVPSAAGTVLNLKLTRNELAQLAGTINESLSRHLTEFKNAGVLELNGKEIIIKDRVALMQKSGNFV